MADLHVFNREGFWPDGHAGEDESYSHRVTENTEADCSVLFVRSVRDLILMLAAWRLIEVLRLSQ